MPNEKRGQAGALLGALLGGLGGGGASIGRDLYRGNKVIDALPSFMRPDKMEAVKRMIPELLQRAAVPAAAGAGLGGVVGGAVEKKMDKSKEKKSPSESEKDDKKDDDKAVDSDKPCPGSKIRSGGKGRGLGTGRGCGPIGIPAGDKEMEEEKQSAWVEGFVAECAELGIPKEGAAVLIKVAAQLAMCEDENFVAGFKAEMEKSAGMGTAVGKGIDALVGAGMRAPAWASIPAGILGFIGAQQLADAVRRRWGRSPEETAILQQLEGADVHPDPGALLEQLDLMRRSGHGLRTPLGGRYTDPLLGGGGRDFDYSARY